MSKTITIPNWMDPYVVHVNGVTYKYPAGETMTVPDGVAAVIQADIDSHNAATDQKDPPKVVRSVNDVSPDKNGNVEIDIPKNVVKTINGTAPDENGNIRVADVNASAVGQTTNNNGEIFNRYAKNQATGTYSHAEGDTTAASGSSSHAEGDSTTADGYGSHAGGLRTAALGSGSFAHGAANKAYSPDDEPLDLSGVGGDYYKWKYTFGQNKLMAIGNYSYAINVNTVAIGQSSFVSGQKNAAYGPLSSANGANTIAVGQGCFTEGVGTKAGVTFTYIGSLEIDTENSTITFTVESSSSLTTPLTIYNLADEESILAVFAMMNSDTGANFVLENLKILSCEDGLITVSYASDADLSELGNIESYDLLRLYLDTQCVYGKGNMCGGYWSHAEGSNTLAYQGAQHVQGCYNLPDYVNKYADIIGNGTSEQRSNAMAVTWTGEIETGSNLSSGGADYAEYFEWADGNPKAEDRVGFIVSLDGEKIRFANAEDTDILGIISGTAGIIGDNAAWEWKQKYQTDDFGRVIWDMVEEFAETTDLEENITKESLGFFPRRRLNPDYNPYKSYKPRSERPEWAVVGMLGKLHVRDDGTCVPNGYAKVGADGTATASAEKTSMRVLKRVSDKIVLVLMK